MRTNTGRRDNNANDMFNDPDFANNNNDIAPKFRDFNERPNKRGPGHNTTQHYRFENAYHNENNGNNKNATHNFFDLRHRQYNDDVYGAHQLQDQDRSKSFRILGLVTTTIRSLFVFLVLAGCTYALISSVFYNSIFPKTAIRAVSEFSRTLRDTAKDNGVDWLAEYVEVSGVDLESKYLKNGETLSDEDGNMRSWYGRRNRDAPQYDDEHNYGDEPGHDEVQINFKDVDVL